MQVNSSIFGEKEDWIGITASGTLQGTYDLLKFKLSPETKVPNIYTGVGNGLVPQVGESIDTSCTFWYINPNADYLQKNYVIPYKTRGNNYNNYESDFSNFAFWTLYDLPDTGVPFITTWYGTSFQGDTGTVALPNNTLLDGVLPDTYTYPKYDYRTATRDNDPIPSEAVNPQKAVKPLMDFDYSEIVLECVCMGYIDTDMPWTEYTNEQGDLTTLWDDIKQEWRDTHHGDSMPYLGVTDFNLGLLYKLAHKEVTTSDHRTKTFADTPLYNDSMIPDFENQNMSPQQLVSSLMYLSFNDLCIPYVQSLYVIPKCKSSNRQVHLDVIPILPTYGYESGNNEYFKNVEESYNYVNPYLTLPYTDNSHYLVSKKAICVSGICTHSWGDFGVYYWQDPITGEPSDNWLNELQHIWDDEEYDPSGFPNRQLLTDNVPIRIATDSALCSNYVNIGSKTDKIQLLPYELFFDSQGNVKTGTDIPTFGEYVDWLYKQVAYLGFKFQDYCNTSDDFFRQTLNNEDLYPVFSDQWVTTGEWKKASEAGDLPNFSWTNDLHDTMPEPPDPDEPPDVPPAPDGTPLPNQDSGDLDTDENSKTYISGIKYYKVTVEALQAIISKINTVAVTPSTDPDLQQDFKGVNPWDYVVSAMVYPFAIPLFLSERISLGGVDTEQSGERVNTQWGGSCLFDFGKVHCGLNTPLFSNYAPYCRMSIQVPYCGTVELDPQVYMGHDIGLKIAIDLPTGICTGYIYRGDQMIDSIDGYCGLSIPLTSYAMGTYQNTIANLGFDLARNTITDKSTLMKTKFDIATSVGSLIGSIFGGGEGSGISGGNAFNDTVNLMQARVDKAQLDYDLGHTAPQVGTIGSATASNTFVKDTRAKVLIWRPTNLLDGNGIKNYRKTVGEATLVSGNLSQFNNTGLVVCSNVQLASDIPATEIEQQMIMNALKEGVYL